MAALVIVLQVIAFVAGGFLLGRSFGKDWDPAGRRPAVPRE
ncbi:MAG TPA: hypothetical protein VIA06_06395 [Candidatus Dormibacteraeota bacterium]|jgi:hypothetical protein|nr:hypothetical protein [Candidatus Dormibacteraeota bacterium]